MARKSVDEIINKFTPEEWRKMIETEMDKLGLYFGEVQEEYKPLFPKESRDEVHSFSISFSPNSLSNEQYAVSYSRQQTLSVPMINIDKMLLDPRSGSLTAA